MPPTADDIDLSAGLQPISQPSGAPPAQDDGIDLSAGLVPLASAASSRSGQPQTPASTAQQPTAAQEGANADFNRFARGPIDLQSPLDNPRPIGILPSLQPPAQTLQNSTADEQEANRLLPNPSRFVPRPPVASPQTMGDLLRNDTEPTTTDVVPGAPVSLEAPQTARQVAGATPFAPADVAEAQRATAAQQEADAQLAGKGPTFGEGLRDAIQQGASNVNSQVIQAVPEGIRQLREGYAKLLPSIQTENGPLTSTTPIQRDAQITSSAPATGNDAMEGLSQFIGGLMGVSTPMLAIELGQNPAMANALIGGISSGIIAGAAAQKGLAALGASQGAQDLGGTLVGLAGGMVGGGIAHAAGESAVPTEIPRGAPEVQPGGDNAQPLPPAERATTPGTKASNLDLDSPIQVARANGPTHPSGKVTGIDQATGLPIVDRSSPAETATSPLSPSNQGANGEVAQPAIAKVEEPESRPQKAVEPATASSLGPQEPAGATGQESGGVAAQPTDKLAAAQKLATAAAPELESKLNDLTAGVEGAEVDSVRPEKDRSRAIVKAAGLGQPPETISDLLASRIVVDSPQARDQVVARLRDQFPVVNENDHFDSGEAKYGFRSHTLQVGMENGATAEVQVVPREVAEVQPQAHPVYVRGREAELAGRDNEAAAAQASNRATHDSAMAKFNQRNRDSDVETNKLTTTPVVESKTAIALHKGDRVTLPDGSQGTVRFLHHKMAIARVDKDGGGDITIATRKLRQLQAEAGRGISPRALGENGDAPSAAKLLEKYSSKGVDGYASETPKDITLNRLVVRDRGRGTGTEFMKDLAAYADQHGKRILLTPTKEFGATSVARLKDFYKRFGFTENSGRVRDFTTKETMIREPGAAVDGIAPRNLETGKEKSARIVRLVRGTLDAAKRSEAARWLRSTFQSVPQDGKQSAYLRINHDAMSWLEEQLYGKGTTLEAFYAKPEAARVIADAIEALGNKRWADAIRNTPSRSGGAIFVRPDAGPDAILEEQHHDAHEAYAAEHAAGVENAERVAPDAYQRATDTVRQMGGPYATASRGMLDTEIFAKIHADDNLRLSMEDKRALHQAYVEGFRRAGGRVGDLPDFDPRLEGESGQKNDSSGGTGGAPQGGQGGDAGRINPRGSFRPDTGGENGQPEQGARAGLRELGGIRPRSVDSGGNGDARTVDGEISREPHLEDDDGERRKREAEGDANHDREGGRPQRDNSPQLPGGISDEAQDRRGRPDDIGERAPGGSGRGTLQPGGVEEPRKAGGWDQVEAAEPDPKEESRARSGEENLAIGRDQNEVIAARGNHAPVIQLGHDLMSYLEKAIFRKGVNALHLTARGANWMIANLPRLGLRDLADKIRDNRSRDGGAILAREGLGSSVLGEEHWHDFQNVYPEAHAAALERAQRENPEAYARAKAAVARTGSYGDLDDAAMGKEVTAKSVTGSDLNIAPEDARAIHDSYVAGLEEHTPGIMDRAPEREARLAGGDDGRRKSLTGSDEEVRQGGQGDVSERSPDVSRAVGSGPEGEFALGGGARSARSGSGTSGLLRDWLNERVTPGDETREAMRETRGQMDRRIAVVQAKLDSARKSWSLRPRAESKAFWDAVEQGNIASLPAKDQDLARYFKSGFDNLKAEIQKYKPAVLQNYIQNYFPHIWKQPSAAASIIRDALTGKRPFAGRGEFLKQRTVPTMADGIALGLEPESWNPVDSFLRKYASMAQFLQGYQTLDEMKQAGTAKFLRWNDKQPAGWSKLDDRIGTVTSINAQGELVTHGHYWSPPDAARIFNNFVSRGLAGRYRAYDAVRMLNDGMNSLQLGISAFHFTTTAVNAATSELALAIKQLSEGKPIRAAGHALSAVLTVPSVARTWLNGGRLLQEYLKPGSYAKFSAEAKAIAESGGRLKQNTLELRPFQAMVNAFRNGALREGISAVPGAILHGVVAPVMEHWVPRMKIGAFYDMAHDVLDQAQKKGWTPDQTRREMQKAWDSVDNRFGQMVYDNLFWHKSLRDALQLGVRSVGWNFGDVRELGGAAVDLAKQGGRAVTGQGFRVTDRMAFATALPIYTALIGGTLTYLWTGRAPQTWKDYFFPRRADGTRVSVPGYAKDVVGFAHAPVQTVLNKMSPVLEMTAEAINNRDFYGTEIRHKDDPYVKQLAQFAEFVGKSGATPFAISGSKKLLENEGENATFDLRHPIDSVTRIGHAIARHPGDVITGNLGFQPAPAYIQNSPALNKAFEYSRENRPPGTKTKARFERQQAMHSVENMYRLGKVDRNTIAGYESSGVLNRGDISRARILSRVDPLVRAVRGLSAEQALNVYAEADASEKQRLAPVLRAKQDKVDDVPLDERAELRARLRTAAAGR